MSSSSQFTGRDQGQGEIVGTEGLRLRPMRDSLSDYRLLAEWRNLPHVREWWDPDLPDMTLDQAISEYQPSLVHDLELLFIIEEADRPIGFIQMSPWSAWEAELQELDLTVPPGAWGLDLFIGEPDCLNRGLGTSVVELACSHVFGERGATAMAFGVEAINLRARRAYEKAGLVPTAEFLDTDTRGGQRVRSILMVRTAPG